MKVKVSHSSNVIGIYDHLNPHQVDDDLKTILQTASLKINTEKVKDWELDFQCYYTQGEEVRVFKSAKPYVKIKQKVVFIHIPIPSIHLVNWGIQKEQYIPVIYPPGMEKYYTSIPIEFESFTSLRDYVVFCAKRGIAFAFSDGITILGQKIKIKESILE